MMKLSDFKAGDVVEVLDDNPWIGKGNYLTLGAHYTIDRVSDEYIHWMDDKGNHNGFPLPRDEGQKWFRKITSTFPSDDFLDAEIDQALEFIQS